MLTIEERVSVDIRLLDKGAIWIVLLRLQKGFVIFHCFCWLSLRFLLRPRRIVDEVLPVCDHHSENWHEMHDQLR